MNVLDDDEDLDSVLCFPLEEVVESVPFVSRSSEVEFG